MHGHGCWRKNYDVQRRQSQLEHIRPVKRLGARVTIQKHKNLANKCNCDQDPIPVFGHASLAVGKSVGVFEVIFVRHGR